MKDLELVLYYKNIIDTKNGGCLSNFEAKKTNTIISKLKETLNNKNNFVSCKDLIFSMEQYPIFVYCSKLYPEYYQSKYNEFDKKIYRTLFYYTCDRMIYLNTNDIDKTIIDINIDNIPTITMDTLYNNKLLALKNYNKEYFVKLSTCARKYVKLYYEEAAKLSSLNNSEFINNFHNIFDESKTYHLKLKMINNLYSLLDSDFKKQIESIINFHITTTDNIYANFKEEFENLEIAYRYKNTKHA